jgi:hypothetical protein
MAPRLSETTLPDVYIHSVGKQKQAHERIARGAACRCRKERPHCGSVHDPEILLAECIRRSGAVCSCSTALLPDSFARGLKVG